MTTKAQALAQPESYCVFCDYIFVNDPEATTLKEHIRICKQHPAYQDKKRADYLTGLAQLTADRLKEFPNTTDPAIISWLQDLGRAIRIYKESK